MCYISEDKEVNVYKNIVSLLETQPLVDFESTPKCGQIERVKEKRMDYRGEVVGVGGS